MPNAILCITGSELTRGETKDLNGPYLATHLTELGAQVDEIWLVPDSPELLARATRAAIEKADLVILSGGLGPTADDYTVQVLGEVFGKRVVRHAEAAERMRSRALARGLTDESIPANYYKQAEVLEGSEVLLNPVGLAPGMILPTHRGFCAVLPGVPREMQAMYLELVAPAIKDRFRLEPPRILRAKILGMGESWAESRIQACGIDFSRVEYGISAKPGELLVKFISHEPVHHTYLDNVRALLARSFQSDIFFLPEGLTDPSGAAIEVDQAKIVHDLLLGSGLKLATAESCTGGGIARALTDHPGSSSYLVGGIVAYSNEVKEKLLRVPRQLLEEHGAVSTQVCEAMARGALEVFGCDLAVAVTGIAGPAGGTPAKPVGLVFTALASRVQGSTTQVAVVQSQLAGKRDMVRQAASIRALELVRRELAARGTGRV